MADEGYCGECGEEDGDDKPVTGPHHKDSCSAYEPPVSFERTWKAVEAYDATQKERDAQLNAATSDEDVRAWQAREREEEQKVALAFWEDTRAFNTKETVLATVKPGPATPAPGEGDVSLVRRAARDWLVELGDFEKPPPYLPSCTFEVPGGPTVFWDETAWRKCVGSSCRCTFHVKWRANIEAKKADAKRAPSHASNCACEAGDTGPCRDREAKLRR